MPRFWHRVADMTTDEPPAARMGLARGFPVPFEQGLDVEARVRSEVQGREVGVSDAMGLGREHRALRALQRAQDLGLAEHDR